ncbi:C-type lectin domain family 2 member B-like isoform 3-T3 [Discoglossus pictus]
MADLELVNSERADSERPDCELSEPITDADEDSPQTGNHSCRCYTILGLLVICFVLIIGITVLAIQISSLVMVLLSPPPHCPEGWYSFPKKCIFFSKNKKTWEKSEEDCTNKNATLASFDLEDPDWMTFLEFIKTEYWIGMWFTRLSVGHWVNRYPRPANLNNMSCGFTSDLDIGVDDCVMSKRWMCEINKDSEDS